LRAWQGTAVASKSNTTTRKFIWFLSFKLNIAKHRRMIHAALRWLKAIHTLADSGGEIYDPLN
jgi:hypothetical protein